VFAVKPVLRIYYTEMKAVNCNQLVKSSLLFCR